MSMDAMLVPALGGYLKTLRTERRLSVAAVLRALKDRLGKETDRSRLWRAENGVHWPDSDYLSALVDILGGSGDDIAWIQSHADATAKDGQALALAAMQATAEQLSDEELQEAIDLFMRLRSDPKALGRWLGYGERLAADTAREEER